MMINLTAITATTYAACVGIPSSGTATAGADVVGPASVSTEPARERAVAPVAATSWGHVRLDDDATGFAGTPAWSPPT